MTSPDEPPVPAQPYAPYPPPAPARRGLSGLSTAQILLLVFGGFLALCVIAAAIAANTSDGTSSPSAATTTNREPTITDDVTATWKQWATATYGTPDWLDLVTSARTGRQYALTIDTQLYPKDSNRDLALAICQAGGAWLLSSSKDDVSVKVNDRAGNVLASRRSGGGDCAWRR